MNPLRLSLPLAVLAAAGVLAVTLGSRPSSECEAGSAVPCVRVLFIGNSYTFVNDLPGTFRALADSADENVGVGMVANGGETLSQHAASAETLAAIDGSRWNVVVLQEQSEIPAFAPSRNASMFPAAAALAARIRAVGALPILLETWAHRDGLPEAGMSESRMQAAINGAYGDLATRLGAGIARAGEAWTAELQAGTSPDTLWQSDGSHPTTAGTRLVACAVYRAVFDGARQPTECSP